MAATYDTRGRMISTCVTPFGVSLIARNPQTLAALTRKKITHWLPIGQKFSGGVYFHLDHQDRVLLASNDSEIQLWALQGEGRKLKWQLQQGIAIDPALDQHQAGRQACGYQCNARLAGQLLVYYPGGIVGVGVGVGISDRDGSAIEVVALPGEGNDNALAVGKNVVFVVSSHAMYGFHRSVDGTPEIMWREVYDRGSAPKPGTMGLGSSTTPTLVGDDYAAITDNADGRVNALVYRQQQDTGDQSPLVCKQAIFPIDRGTTENSLSAVGHSLIAENNLGYQGPYENITAEPGLARIDINADGKSCTLAWENLEISSPSAVPKVSLGNGLIYLYTRDPGNDPALQAWYFTVVDFKTGKRVYKVLTGIGPGYNNHY